MTAFTPNFSIPYQTLADPPDGPNLGEDGFLVVDTALAGLDSRLDVIESNDALNARLRAIKTTGQALATSSTVLQNVTGLSLPVVAGTYAWDLLMPYEASSNTPDIKVAMTFPTSSSASFNYLILPAAVTGAPPYALEMGGGSTVTSGVAFVAAGTVGLRATLHVYGHIVFTASGAVQVQAAQNTSDLNAVTVHPGARLTLDRTA